MRRSSACLAATFLLAASCSKYTMMTVSPLQSPVEEIDALAANAEQAREATPALRALLRSSSADERARAALAVGRIGDVESMPYLAPLLSHSGPDGAMAAWALGRLQAPKLTPGAPPEEPMDASAAETVLRGCLLNHCAQEVAAARALGAGGRSEKTIAQLVAALDGAPELAARAGTSLGIIARLDKGSDAKIAAAASAGLWQALARPESEPRLGAAYALGRLPRPGPATPPNTPAPPLDEASKAALLAALRDPDPDVRALAARAAGKQGLAASELAPALADRDWRVRVEVARALATAPGGNAVIVPAILAAAAQLSSAHEVEAARWAHPLIELLATGAALKIPRESFPAPETLSGPTPASTINVRCAAAEARDRRANAVMETPKCAAGLELAWRSRVRVANLAGDLAGDHPESQAGEALKSALVDSDPRVRAAAAGAASIAFSSQLIDRLSDPDPFVVSSAAGSLAKDPAIARASLPAASLAFSRFVSARRDPAGNARADALVSLVQLVSAAVAPKAAGEKPYPLPPEMISLQPVFSFSEAGVASVPLFQSLAELQAALGAPEEKPAPHAPAPPIPQEAKAGLPGHGPRSRTLVLTTTAGDMRVHLFTANDATPLTSAAVATLANRGFYDGLFWHRVVPDFVVQGGDPMGDGDGGPGWALPDEHTPTPFLRGSMGIATGGPETGGSQLFLCHAPQPHLDGRYTVTGQLESGEAAMDALQVGDTILKARAE